MHRFIFPFLLFSSLFCFSLSFLCSVPFSFHWTFKFSIYLCFVFTFFCYRCRSSSWSFFVAFSQLTQWMFRSVSLVAYGIPTEFHKYHLQFTTDTKYCRESVRDRREVSGTLFSGSPFSSFLEACECVSECAELLHSVELTLHTAKERKCGCKQNIYVKTTKYGENNLNILFIFLLSMKSYRTEWDASARAQNRAHHVN